MSETDPVRTVRTEDHHSDALADGFVDHGSVGFVLADRGWVSTSDGDGNDVVLIWLWEGASGDGWLGMLTVDTGEFEEFDPCDGAIGAPYASLLSSDNHYYACNRHFVAFDPTQPGCSVLETDVDGGDARAMSLTEDDAGTIWAATYPNATVVSYDPKMDRVRDYGRIYEHPSTMFPRSIAADAAGWIYVGIRPAASQIVILDPDTGDTTPVLPPEETPDEIPGGEYGPGQLPVTRATDGSVYGRIGDRWFELYDGEATELTTEPDFEEVPIVSGWQNLRHGDLPSGRDVTTVDLETATPYATIADPETDETQTVCFDPSGGDATPMGLTLAPDGSIVGGTYIPHQCFQFDPETDEWFRAINVNQWNTLATTDAAVYAGGYPDGSLWRWEPDEPWAPPDERDPDVESNPRFLVNDRRNLHRPFSMVTHPDGRYVIMGSQPDYGHAGGGLLFWDRHEETATVRTHEELLPGHIPQSLAVLSTGDVVGGTNVRPAGGGVQQADVAELFCMDVDDKAVRWREAPLEGVERYQDLTVTADDVIIGVADRERLFAVDPADRSVLHDTALAEQTANQQGPDNFVWTDDDRLFLLFDSGRIAEVDPATCEVSTRATAPSRIRNGGAFRDGRLYFATEAHVYSWTVPSRS